MNRKLRIILIILLAAVFCFSAYMIISDLAESHREKETYTSLADLVHSREQERIESSQSGGNGESTPGSKDVPKKYIGEDGSITQEVVVPAAPVYAESGILYQYDAVYELNNDLAGWLYIEGAGIDYPVMYTPRNEQYYLRKNFEKTYATGGCLFIGKTWSEDSNQTIIYGHNMHDGSMFGHLHEYKSKEYALEHSIIHFDTLHETREYEVVAAFYGKV